jgi:hypothetical protein
MPVLRPCTGALATALQDGVPLWKADLFSLTLTSGATNRFTDFDSDLTVGGFFFSSVAPFFKTVRWRVVHTMEVPTLELRVLDSNAVYLNGLSLKTLAHQGFLDGASLFLQRVFIPPSLPPLDTTTYGTIDIFAGDVGAVDLSEGAVIPIKVRGKNSRLNVPAPKNVYQPGCIHTFCDAGCTLSAGTFTHPYTTFTGSTRSIVTINSVSGSLLLKGGTLVMTSGVSSGQQRSIIDFTFTGANLLTSVTLAYPLPTAPLAGDTFTLFNGCDKTMNTCNVNYVNLVNFRGFPFIPPPATAAAGQ